MCTFRLLFEFLSSFTVFFEARDNACAGGDLMPRLLNSNLLPIIKFFRDGNRRKLSIQPNENKRPEKKTRRIVIHFSHRKTSVCVYMHVGEIVWEKCVSCAS